jgi:hypothetical protein
MTTYQPSTEEILKRYLLKFSQGGKASNLHEDDLGLLDVSAASDDIYVQNLDSE